MRILYITLGTILSFFANAQTTNSYTSSTTWTVPAGVSSISVKVWGGGGGTGGQDCGAGCTNAAAGNAGYVVASFAVSPGNIVGIYPGGQGTNGTSAATSSGGGAGGVSSYPGFYGGGKGGNAGPVGSSGGGGGGGAAPAGDGGGGGGGGGGSYGALGGSLHTAGAEQAGDGGSIGNNLVSGASTTTTNGNIAWTSGGRIDITYNITLPVTWLDFTANRQANNSIALNWSTAAEINTLSYRIERSTNGNDWSTIGEVPAAGNSIAKLSYQYIDKSTVAGNYYYRLAQIDLDKHISYSKTVVCAADGGNIRLYPNPTYDQTVRLVIPKASVVTIFNVQGQALMTKQLPAGDNKLNLTGYTPGVYFLQTEDRKISFIIK